MVNKHPKRNAKSAATVGKEKRKSKLVESLAFRLRIAYFNPLFFSQSNAFVENFLIRNLLDHMSVKEYFSEGT